MEKDINRDIRYVLVKDNNENTWITEGLDSPLRKQVKDLYLKMIKESQQDDINCKAFAEFKKLIIDNEVLYESHNVTHKDNKYLDEVLSDNELNFLRSIADQAFMMTQYIHGYVRSGVDIPNDNHSKIQNDTYIFLDKLDVNNDAKKYGRSSVTFTVCPTNHVIKQRILKSIRNSDIELFKTFEKEAGINPPKNILNK